MYIFDHSYTGTYILKDEKCFPLKIQFIVCCFIPFTVIVLLIRYIRAGKKCKFRFLLYLCIKSCFNDLNMTKICLQNVMI